MPLGPGTRLGPYEILAAIGAGGMGEVYRARDTKLGRDVAIKILPASLTGDPDRLARFTREAQMLASLNHPHIAAIHHVEDTADGPAIVMELVEGETLADRIARGPIPIDEALPIAKQIAGALEAAHEQGIIHRDLKPGNIKVTPDGVVKVLDFGLAKLNEPVGSGQPAVGSLSHSPTITSPALMTGVGVLLGTAAYMSPEQARGRPVDKRADIWAFGAVLFEMLAGTRAFEDEDVSMTLSKVLQREPDFDTLPSTIPARVRQALRLCLRKDPKQRVADIRDVRLALEGAFETGVAPSAQPIVNTQPAWRRAVVPLAMLLVGASLASAAVWFATRPVPPRLTRMTITPPEATALTIDGFDRDLAITPDGRRVVYAGANGTEIFVRQLDALDPTPLVAVNGNGQGLFTSPDGQWVGYVENNDTLKKVAVTGGPAVTLLKMDGNSRGVTWAADDTLVFATVAPSGLQRVAASGGAATVLTRPDRARGESDHLWPEALPGGRQVLYTIMGRGELDAAEVAVLDLTTGVSKTVLRGGYHAHYVASGHLVYAAGGTLRAVAFDPVRLEIRGTPVPVVPRLFTTSNGGADFGVAGNGTLVYVDAPGRGVSARRTLVWVDRQGREQPVNLPLRAYTYVQLSPDGTKVALDIRDQENDIWIWDLPRGTLQRLTFDPGLNREAVWTPDGKRVAFSAAKPDGSEEVYWQAADGSGIAERLTEGTMRGAIPTSFLPDGSGLLYTEPDSPRDLWMVKVEGPRTGQRLIATAANEQNGVVSPDGRWLAYQSNESGRDEIYVRPFPAVDTGRWQISTNGGTRPHWRRDGRELFYFLQQGDAGALMSAAVEPGSGFTAGRQTMLFQGNYPAPNAGRQLYDVSLDGQRFLMIKNADAEAKVSPPQIIVVQNWFEELKRLVPTN